jgi:hypothetical protein
MTPKEAALFLKLEDLDDVQDRWEEELFDIKRFFLISTPIPKVFTSKLTRLKKYLEAYEVLSGNEIPEATEHMTNEEVSFSDDVELAFHELHKKRTRFKQLIHATDNPYTIECIVKEWLSIEGDYLLKWKFSESKALEEEVVQSKEPDPMELLEAIKQWKSSADLSTFQQLHTDFSFLPKKLKIEVKRLTLLSNYYGEGLI